MTSKGPQIICHKPSPDTLVFPGSSHVNLYYLRRTASQSLSHSQAGKRRWHSQEAGVKPPVPRVTSPTCSGNDSMCVCLRCGSHGEKQVHGHLPKINQSLFQGDNNTELGDQQEWHSGLTPP